MWDLNFKTQTQGCNNSQHKRAKATMLWCRKVFSPNCDKMIEVCSAGYGPGKTAHTQYSLRDIHMKLEHISVKQMTHYFHTETVWTSAHLPHYIIIPICHKGICVNISTKTQLGIKTNSVALSLRVNYTDWATATCRRNLVPTFVDRGASRGQRGGSPTDVNLSFLDWRCYFSFK
jgi:hypothetical protein